MGSAALLCGAIGVVCTSSSNGSDAEPDTPKTAVATPEAKRSAAVPTPEEVCLKIGQLADPRTARANALGRDDPDFLDNCMAHYEGIRSVKFGEVIFGRVAGCVMKATSQLQVAECHLPVHDDAPEPKKDLARLASAVMRYALDPGPDGWPRLRCPPVHGSAVGVIGPTPALAERCGSKPDGCTTDDWSSDPAWRALGFSVEGPQRFHYAVRYSNEGAGVPAGCQFTAQAFADLDDDGVFATYERAAAIDGWGPAVAAGLYIDREDE